MYLILSSLFGLLTERCLGHWPENQSNKIHLDYRYVVLCQTIVDLADTICETLRLNIMIVIT